MLRTQAWKSWGAAALVQMAVFTLLFFWWMPANTTLSGYYGIQYFLGPDTGPGAVSALSALLSNLVSLQSMETLMLTIAFSGLFFARWNMATFALLVAAAPGLLLILASRAEMIHHPANHYPLAALPFLIVAGIHALVSRSISPKAHLLRTALLLTIGVVAGYTLLHRGGVVDNLAALSRASWTKHIREDVATIRGKIPADAKLMVDLTLQPLFADHRDVSLTLGFVGNPHRLKAEDLALISTVVTEAPLHLIEDCRSERQLGGVGMRAV
jgi:hypothetical protein